MGQVTKADPSCYLVLLSFGKKTNKTDTHPRPEPCALLMQQMDYASNLNSTSTDTTKTLFWSNTKHMANEKFCENKKTLWLRWDDKCQIEKAWT